MTIELDALVASLTGRPEISAIVAGFKPPPRFRDKTFANFHPLRPSQVAASQTLESASREAEVGRRMGLIRRFLPNLHQKQAFRGIYVDGGFGVGKTHLLAAFWNAAPWPKAYMAFDELMYFIGLVGPKEAASSLENCGAIAIDEWELDDPGNLKLALAFLRQISTRMMHLVVTSNTLPLELGSGRFSQKDFATEIDELAGAFEVITMDGEDYRHRNFVGGPDSRIFVPESVLAQKAREGSERTVICDFSSLLGAIGEVHPIRYRELARRVDELVVADVTSIQDLAEGLRWVHLVDSLYDADVRFVASANIGLGEIFRGDDLNGPFAKKLRRCLSRMGELLAEATTV